jgi:hypothetical protein
VAEWWLGSPRVRRVLGEVTGEEEAQAVEILGKIEVPAAVYDWKRSPEQRKLAEHIQTSNRLALESAFGRGLAVTGYELSPEGDGRFLLGAVSGI